MISEEVGKLLINTQHEIKNLKAELDQGLKSNEDYELLYNKLKDQLSKFEERMQSNVENIINSDVLNNDQLLNKLPLIKVNNNNNVNNNNSNLNADDAISVSGSLAGSSYKQYLTNSNTLMPTSNSTRFDIKQIKLSNKLPKSLLREKIDLPIKKAEHSNSLQPLSNTRPLIKSKFIEKGKSTIVSTNDIRKHAYNIPPITEKDIKQGMLSLINRGLIPRDVDLTPAFKRGAPPVQSQKVRFHDHREQFIRGEVSSFPAYLLNAKYDLRPTAINQKTEPLYNQGPLMYNFTKTTTYKLALDGNLPDIAPVNNSSKMSSKDNHKMGSDEELKLNLVEARAKDYEEVVDVYSLHQFIIRRGKTLIETPEFISYKRIYHNAWNNIEKIIGFLEKLLTEYDIKIAYIDGKKVAALAEIKDIKPTTAELVDCIVNKDEVKKIIKIPRQKPLLKGPNAANAAATLIQSYYRMYRCRKAYKRIRMLIGRVTIIQRAARNYLMYKQTQAIIRNKKEDQHKRFQELTEKFKKDWNEIKLKRRTEIHISALSYEENQRISMEKYIQKQNAQISRLFALKDPLVDVIYIAPFDLPSEITGYYSKVFELGGLDQNQTRFHVVHPESISTFPSHFTMTRVLLYSPKALRRIRQLIKGKLAYIVPGVPSNDDIELSTLLNVPLLSGDPQKNFLYSTKSGAKRIFNLCEVPTPPGSFNIYDETEFILTLTKLIAYNLDVSKWLFKIDDEFNGRGHAVLCVDQIKPLTDLRKKNLSVNEELINKIHEIISKLLPSKIKIAVPSLYKNYQEYIQKFVSKGGVIEAMPNCPSVQLSSCSISMLIDPLGEFSLIGSYDKIFVTDFVTGGYFFPQKSIPNINLQTLCQTVSKTLYSEGVFGYITIDLITFPDSSVKMTGKVNNERLFWAIDLNCYMTTYTGATFFFDFLMSGKIDPISGIYTIRKLENPSTITKKNGSELSVNSETQLGDNKTEEKRCFMYFPFIHHPGLNSIHYKTFFHLCRLKSISYDLENKIGTTFILLDNLQTGVLGLFTIGRYRRTVVRYMYETLSFIMSQAGTAEFKYGSQNGMSDSRNDGIQFSDIMSKVKLLNVAFEKKQAKFNQNLLQGSI